MEKVAVVECKSYENELVKEKVLQMLNLLDVRSIEKGKCVVIKANLVSAISPDKCATSHPSIVKAVAEWVLGQGAECIIADSSGGPFNSVYMKNVYRVTKMNEVCEQTGAKLNENFSYSIVRNENAQMHKNLPIIDVLNNADYIINIAKLKTHTFMGYSGAVKNMFGAIPGLMKVEMHGNFKDQFSFSNHIIDINETLKDKMLLSIIDGVEGMEGDGPTGGTKVHLGCILGGANAYYLDYVMLKIMDIEPNEMPLLKAQIDRNLLGDLEHLQIVGDDYHNFIKTNLDVPQIEIFAQNSKKVPLFLNGFVQNLVSRRPAIDKNKCKGCKKCFDHCPAKAIEMHTKKDNKQYAKIDCTKCIRCFCCQELCPFNLVKIKSGLVYKIVHKNKKKK